MAFRLRPYLSSLVYRNWAWPTKPFQQYKWLRKSGAIQENVVYGTLSSFSIGERDCEVKLRREIISAFSP